jgi:hypothetical protein
MEFYHALRGIDVFRFVYMASCFVTRHDANDIARLPQSGLTDVGHMTPHPVGNEEEQGYG